MLFLYALNSPVTRERYSTRLRYFLSKIGLTNGSIEELCRIFVEKGKQDPNWIIDNIVAFLMEYRGRFDRRYISGSTIRIYVKVVKLCEMNDIPIPWKKITRGLPKGRHWADDRARKQGWNVHAMAKGHEVMITHPKELAEILLE